MQSLEISELMCKKNCKEVSSGVLSSLGCYGITLVILEKNPGTYCRIKVNPKSQPDHLFDGFFCIISMANGGFKEAAGHFLEE